MSGDRDGFRLGHTVLSKGKVYPAGTPFSDDLAGIIDQRHWVDQDGNTVEVDLPAGGDVDEHVAALTAQIESLTEQLEQAKQQAPAGPEADTIDSIMEWVGAGTKDRAVGQLAAEQEKGDKARPTLVEKLEAVITEPSQGD